MKYSRVELHAGYGAVPANGEVVHTGEVIGLSADAREVVVASHTGPLSLEAFTDHGKQKLYASIPSPKEGDKIRPAHCESAPAKLRSLF
jgi:hypothetical protein